MKDRLKELVEQWRGEAQGKYCQTYNKGMAQGLEMAAYELEMFIDEISEDDCPACFVPLHTFTDGSRACTNETCPNYGKDSHAKN